jgi:hypothetical protein
MLRRIIKNNKRHMALQKSTIRTGRRYRHLILTSSIVAVILALGILALSALWPDRAQTGAQAAAVLQPSTVHNATVISNTKQNAELTEEDTPPIERETTPQKIERSTARSNTAQGPAGRRGVYLSSLAAARPSKIDEVIQKSRALGLNAVVIDVKDNHGVVSYDSKVPLAKTIGARTNRLNLKDLLPKLKSSGLYVIARHVLFYDPKFAKHFKTATAPWVSATDSRIVQYNLAIAEEVANLGFDEIQFDYVRFADEGKMKPVYPARYEAITNFIKQARAKLGKKVYLSADVFGRTLWAWNMKKIDPIGQHLESLDPHLDYLSPMIYPSHYETDKLRNDPYGTIKLALQAGIKRNLAMRPFLQAFDMKIPSTMRYAQYIIAQVRAAQELGIDSYLFWNPEANYSTLWKALELMQSKSTTNN